MRLDHLLSKEHHEVWAGPQRADSPVPNGFVGWAAPVVGVVLVHGKQSSRDGVLFLAPPNTLLGFETTSLLFLDCGLGGVLLLRFGGGVWCLICG